MFSNCEKRDTDLFKAIEIAVCIISRGNKNLSSAKKECDPAL
jgi:hypothetical protein